MRGLFDLHGNLFEWCYDWYSGYAGDAVEGVPGEDPTGSPQGSIRVYRGGGWNYGAADCRSAYRENSRPTRRINYLGIRVAAFPFSQASESAKEGAREAGSESREAD